MRRSATTIITTIVTLMFVVQLVVVSNAFSSVSVAPFSAQRSTTTSLMTPAEKRQRQHATSSPTTRIYASSSSTTSTTTTAAAPTKQEDIQKIQDSVADLKKVLYREYTSFFNPMERDYYANDVTFVDPMTSFTGVDKYAGNVDMLAGRTLGGKIGFKDAGIVLHKVEGGDVKNADDKSGGEISQIITRWTLRLTVQVLPWQPTARFTGISVYTVKAGGPKGVLVKRQDDFWDSVNLQPGGDYKAVDKQKGISDFLAQLSPNQMAAPSASNAELPYQLLRRGTDYEVRRYPGFVAVETDYERRDEGYGELGAFCTGGAINPLAPALLNVPPEKSSSSSSSKSMMWPLDYALPGSNDAPSNPAAVKKAKEDAWKRCKIVNVPERVVAVGIFSDATIEPIVRKAHAKLCQSCRRDGLTMKEERAAADGDKKDPESLNFAQYDAIYSMGQRRSEVWIELKDGGHPW